MEILDKVINYVYLILTIIIVIILIVILVKVKKIMNSISQSSSSVSNINNNLQVIKTKAEAIKQSKDSWSFLVGIATVLLIIKEGIKYSKKNNESLGKSFIKSAVKHKSGIKNIKLS